MLHAIKHRHNTSLRNSTRMVPPFLPFYELNLCNDYIFFDPEYVDQLRFLSQVDSNTNLLDNIILHRNQTKNKECRPTQIDTKEN
mmetsp:Transcript_24375/g.27269  ORF Transcript_24375/g.27269 Transcript_24375/m.27269 type:complete len:85 (-) Transcript_24375:324-578(-)